ncbi:MAG TPA: hypothetical protein VNA69_18230 [Thermoanaerobaculia bacterium]|nr:hypothetical protein [Thermoanaerobaculia bacterium]
MQRTFVAFVIASTFFMAAVLLLDSDGLVRQSALGLATGAFLWLFARRLSVAPRQILTAIVVASIGEVVLSLGWGLYSYQHALIPLYVPPGHGLFYTLAAATAHQTLMQRHARTITRAVVVSGTCIAVLSAVAFGDTWGFLWWLAALALIARSRNQLLLSACFVYTILLEWAGTAIGNWQWAAVVPFVGLHSANPPAGVGLLYILLDLIVCSAIPALVSRTYASERSAAPLNLA